MWGLVRVESNGVSGRTECGSECVAEGTVPRSRNPLISELSAGGT